MAGPTLRGAALGLALTTLVALRPVAAEARRGVVVVGGVGAIHLEKRTPLALSTTSAVARLEAGVRLGEHTAARALSILHQDDFYKTDADIPFITTPTNCPSGLGSRTLQDWDSVDSLDLPLFTSTLTHVKQHGRIPDGSVSKEDQNAVGPTSIDESTISSLHDDVESWFSSLPTTTNTHLRIYILDGFLLYPTPPSQTSPSPSTSPQTQPQTQMQTQLLHNSSNLLDLKLFLPCTRTQTIDRRTKRTGYVTLEGFWEDPPGYVEDVVWPNYVRDHSWMFQAGKEMEGTVDEEVAGREGVIVVPGGGTWGMRELVDWAVEKVKRGVEETGGMGRDRSNGNSAAQPSS